MDEAGQVISFHVVPGPKGLAEAEQCLRRAGFEQIQRSHDGKRLQVVASRELVERFLGCALQRQPRRRKVRGIERQAVEWQLPPGAVLPPMLQEVGAELLFPVLPDYHQ
jgi:hypothetical protein